MRQITVNIRGSLRYLLPIMFGIAVGRYTILVIAYDSYRGSDAGAFSDLMTFPVAVGMLSLLVISAFKVRWSDAQARKIQYFSSILAILGTAAILAQRLSGHWEGGFDLWTVIFTMIPFVAANISLFSWLRTLVGSSSAVVAFSILFMIIISEGILAISSLLARELELVLVLVVLIAQLVLYRFHMTREQPGEKYPLVEQRSGFGSHHNISNYAFLFSMAAVTWLLAMPIGLGRGFPDGHEIAFSRAGRAAYVLLTVIVCLIWIAIAFKLGAQSFTMTIWMGSIGLVVLSALSYAFFPQDLGIGAVFITVANVFILGYVWYAMVIFASYGTNDPFYYMASGWIAFMIPRALGRVILTGSAPFSGSPIQGDETVIIALMLAFCVFTTMVFSLFFMQSPEETIPAAEVKPRSPMRSLFALPEGLDSGADLRKASMERSVAAIAQQFLLSERETEVLSLYALGFTQKSVADELGISPATVHTHIKNSYRKTGFSSRQDILDYIEEYV